MLPIDLTSSKDVEKYLSQFQTKTNVKKSGGISKIMSIFKKKKDIDLLDAIENEK